MDKKLFFTIGTCLAIALFLLHWAIVAILAMPENYVKKVVAFRVHPFQKAFVSWQFFTPPATYNDRLYYIVRDTSLPHAKPDTIEVLANIALRKQRHAPFNTNENVIDHLVNNNVYWLKKTIASYREIAGKDSLALMGSLPAGEALAGLQKNESYTRYIATLTNYCKAALVQNNIAIRNKEVKIVIKQKAIRPFKSMGDTAFVAKETLIYETSFKPLAQ